LVENRAFLFRNIDFLFRKAVVLALTAAFEAKGGGGFYRAGPVTDTGSRGSSGLDRPVIQNYRIV
jgi:hypothetical protein